VILLFVASTVLIVYMKDVPLILCVCNTPKRNLSDRDEEQQYIKQMKDKRYQDVIKKKVANQYK